MNMQQQLAPQHPNFFTTVTHPHQNLQTQTQLPHHMHVHNQLLLHAQQFPLFPVEPQGLQQVQQGMQYAPQPVTRQLFSPAFDTVHNLYPTQSTTTSVATSAAAFFNALPQRQARHAPLAPLDFDGVDAEEDDDTAVPRTSYRYPGAGGGEGSGVGRGRDDGFDESDDGGGEASRSRRGGVMGRAFARRSSN